MQIDLYDILKPIGFNRKIPTRIVRHDKDRPEFEKLELFEIYQSYQIRPVFHSARQLVSFVKMPGTYARFHGVYKVQGVGPRSHGPRPQKGAWPAKWSRKAKFYYNLERDHRFDHLIDRLTIDWGRGRNWVQHFRPVPVVEISAPGRALAPFRDYSEFSISYRQLQWLTSRPESHRDWHSALSAVAGVYLILDEKKGTQYVGSAYGPDGVWGRWRSYSKTGHCGNKLLKKLVKGNPKHYPEKFRFSILQVLPKSMEKSEVIDREALFKNKLGSRAHGLNAN